MPQAHQCLLYRNATAYGEHARGDMDVPATKHTAIAPLPHDELRARVPSSPHSQSTARTTDSESITRGQCRRRPARRVRPPRTAHRRRREHRRTHSPPQCRRLKSKTPATVSATRRRPYVMTLRTREAAGVQTRALRDRELHFFEFFCDEIGREFRRTHTVDDDIDAVVPLFCDPVGRARNVSNTRGAESAVRMGFACAVVACGSGTTATSTHGPCCICVESQRCRSSYNRKPVHTEAMLSERTAASQSF